MNEEKLCPICCKFPADKDNKDSKVPLCNDCEEKYKRIVRLIKKNRLFYSKADCSYFLSKKSIPACKVEKSTIEDYIRPSRRKNISHVEKLFEWYKVLTDNLLDKNDLFKGSFEIYEKSLDDTINFYKKYNKALNNDERLKKVLESMYKFEHGEDPEPGDKIIEDYKDKKKNQKQDIIPSILFMYVIQQRAKKGTKQEDKNNTKQDDVSEKTKQKFEDADTELKKFLKKEKQFVKSL